MEFIINLFWISASVALLILLVLLILLFILLAWYLMLKEEEKARSKSTTKLTFDGPSRIEMSTTTARLLKEDRRRYRRPYMRAKVAMSSNR